jgi:hypothetical protein
MACSAVNPFSASSNRGVRLSSAPPVNVEALQGRVHAFAETTVARLATIQHEAAPS